MTVSNLIIGATLGVPTGSGMVWATLSEKAWSQLSIWATHGAPTGSGGIWATLTGMTVSHLMI